ncbi:MAG: nucleotide sugar dehydrogenase [Micromonosporaceae bacterium]|nr:nucleotide sugar dehydrogenase [Micromonosporaceae bacterium]
MPSPVETETSTISDHVNDLARNRGWRFDETLPETRWQHRETPQPERFGFRVAIVGLGYVGLPTILAFHAAGYRVLGVDISERRLDVIREQQADLLESDRERLAVALADPQRFVLSSDVGLLQAAESILICVPTPIDEHLLPDLRLLEAACGMVVRHAVAGQTIIATSTTYVGCTREMLSVPLEVRGLVPGRDVFVAFSPERIDPGNERHAHETVPRVVGGATQRCLSQAADALAGCSSVLCPVSSIEVAELTKLYENTFRAVNICLANEFADISSVLGLDVAEVIKAASTKPYGFMPFYPGPGVGGHCIPCDPHYLLWQLRSKRVTAPLIEQSMVSVATRPARVVRRATEILGAGGIPVGGSQVLVVGVSYKPGIADVRESPALEIISGLRALGAHIGFSDPLIPSITVDREVMLSVLEPGRHDWDLVIVHTAHPGVDLTWLGRQPNVLDATYRLTSVPHRHTL